MVVEVVGIGTIGMKRGRRGGKGGDEERRSVSFCDGSLLCWSWRDLGLGFGVILDMKVGPVGRTKSILLSLELLGWESQSCCYCLPCKDNFCFLGDDQMHAVKRDSPNKIHIDFISDTPC